MVAAGKMLALRIPTVGSGVEGECQSVIVVPFSETVSDNRVGDVGDLGFGPKIVSGPFLTISTR